MMKVGFGYDVHRLVYGRKLILGGVEIAFEQGLAGHSDADVLCHAIGDALLGAAGRGDMGVHFPPSDRQYDNISSLILLENIQTLLAFDYEIINIDATIVAERPRMGPFVNQMKTNIADKLKIRLGQISIKATTNEGLGFIGAGQGIAAYAVCLIESKLH